MILERTALVHYFKTRKKIMISTEAGAKGLNMQFCNIVINYDLPWNPQRIEQRIGRCHRYGQERDVLVINCINADNETEQRIYDILYNKFDLFKSVLGSGDDVLGTLSKAINFETRINDILNKFKTKEERLLWLQKFEEEITEETKRLKDRKLMETRKLIDELDPNVTKRLKDIQDKLPDSFSNYDKDMLTLLDHYAQVNNLSFSIVNQEPEQIYFQLDGCKYYIGKRDEDKIREFEHISQNHELLGKAIAEIQANTHNLADSIHFEYSSAPDKSAILKPFVDRCGKWLLYKVNFKGLEEEEKLYDIVSIELDDGVHFFKKDEIDALQNLPFYKGNSFASSINDGEMETFLQKTMQNDNYQIQNDQQPRIDKKIHNLEVELKDMEAYLKKEELGTIQEIEDVDKKIRNTYNRDEGKKLIKQKETLQKALTKIRTDLIEFQNQFAEIYSQEQLRLVEKRFIDNNVEKIFELDFKIV